MKKKSELIKKNSNLIKIFSNSTEYWNKSQNKKENENKKEGEKDKDKEVNYRQKEKDILDEKDRIYIYNLKEPLIIWKNSIFTLDVIIFSLIK